MACHVRPAKIGTERDKRVLQGVTQHHVVVLCDRAKGKAPALITDDMPTGGGRGSSNSSSGQASSSGQSSSIRPRSTKGRRKQPPPRVMVHGVAVCREKLEEFYLHADETNEIFRVAAQVVAITLVEAHRLLQLQKQESQQADTSSTQPVDSSTQGKEQQQQQEQEALQQAFLPFAVGHKAPWWEVVTLDEDDDDEHCSEDELRAQVR